MNYEQSDRQWSSSYLPFTQNSCTTIGQPLSGHSIVRPFGTLAFRDPFLQILHTTAYDDHKQNATIIILLHLVTSGPYSHSPSTRWLFAPRHQNMSTKALNPKKRKKGEKILEVIAMWREMARAGATMGDGRQCTAKAIVYCRRLVVIAPLAVINFATHTFCLTLDCYP